MIDIMYYIHSLSCIYLKKICLHLMFTENQLKIASDSKVFRMPGENLRTFLMSQIVGLLRGGQPKNIHQLCDLYDR